MQRDRRRGNRTRTQTYHAETATTKVGKARLGDALEAKPGALEALKKAVEPEPLPRVVEDVPAGEPEASGDAGEGAADGAKPVRRVAKKYSRDEMHARLVKAQGSHAITDAVEAFFFAGYTLEEDDQEGWLQLLEHKDEARVREAIERLRKSFLRKPVRHKPLLSQRLRRIEDNADEPATREAAADLRKSL
jgi:hypothetical protein